MTHRLTRRGALAAVGTLALAGCTGNEPRFWEDPPELDTTDVSRALESPVPGHPQVIPITFEPDTADRFVDRVERLIDPIPDPLSAATLPNGAIRGQITSKRRDAREALSASETDRTPLRTAERLATARSHAATAAGTWAAVATEGAPAAVTDGAATVRARTGRVLDTLPGDASDPIVGAAVYGPIERWLDVARRRTLVGSTTVEERANPLRGGRTVGDIERIQSHIDAGRYLRDRYRASLATPRDVEASLRAETARLGVELTDQLRELHGGEADRIRSHPGIEAFLAEQPVARGAPSLSLLSRASGRTFEDLWFDPVAIDGHRPDHPATALCRTTLAQVRLNALDVVAAWIEDGETLFPQDADTVEAAREAAIDAIAALTTADNRLQRWLGIRFISLFAEPDAALAATASDARPVARAFATYRWIETVADEGAAVAETVAGSIDG